jgi:hypothetical protein
MSKKFRVWDSFQLNESIKYSIQFKTKLEELCISNKKSLEDIPDSIVPSSILYMIVISNEIMYKKLLEQDLIQVSNPTNNLNIH